jgi:hypothetical protein
MSMNIETGPSIQMPFGKLAVCQTAGAGRVAASAEVSAHGGSTHICQNATRKQ